jgi:Spy/CpxP family protein refolding chaperone
MTDSSQSRRRRFGLVAIAATIAVVAGGALVYAHSGGGHHGPMSGNAEQHLEHVQAMLSKIGASEAQKAQIDGILKPALADMKAAHEAHSAAFKQFHEAMTAPSIDRVRLESLRADLMKTLDATSTRLVTALSDAAEVLTPEQRAELARKIEEHHRG